MPCVFSQRKKPGRQTAPVGVLPVEPQFFRQFNVTYGSGFPLFQPNALFYLLHAERLALLDKDMHFAVPDCPDQPDQFLLLWGQLNVLLSVHASPAFLFHRNHCAYQILCRRAAEKNGCGGALQQASYHRNHFDDISICTAVLPTRASVKISPAFSGRPNDWLSPTDSFLNAHGIG